MGLLPVQYAYSMEEVTMLWLSCVEFAWKKKQNKKTP